MPIAFEDHGGSMRLTLTDAEYTHALAILAFWQAPRFSEQLATQLAVFFSQVESEQLTVRATKMKELSKEDQLLIDSLIEEKRPKRTKETDEESSAP